MQSSLAKLVTFSANGPCFVYPIGYHTTDAVSYLHNGSTHGITFDYERFLSLDVITFPFLFQRNTVPAQTYGAALFSGPGKDEYEIAALLYVHLFLNDTHSVNISALGRTINFKGSLFTHQL